MQSFTYPATRPVGGAYLTAAGKKINEDKLGFVPYFVSGPLAAGANFIGFFGTVLHVASWVLAVFFDIYIIQKINTEHCKAAHALWIAGFITLLVALVILLVTTVYHAFQGKNGENKIPIGGMPPFLMTSMIGGAQIAAALTFLNMIQTATNSSGTYKPYYMDGDNKGTLAEGEDAANMINEFRNLLLMAFMFKVYAFSFLRNNQEWAGPANVLGSD